MILTEVAHPAVGSRLTMKILTKENASELLGQKPLDNFLSELSSRLSLVNDTYSIPPESLAKTDLSRLFAHVLLRRSPEVYIYISAWGMWGNSEELDLIYGYRRSLGETRTLMEAPVHLFRPSDEAAFVSILSIVFYFIWDAWIFDTAGKTLVRIHHHEWLEIRTDDEDARKEFVTELEGFKIRLLHGK